MSMGSILFQVVWIVSLQATKVALVSSQKNISSCKMCKDAKRKDRSYIKDFQRSCRPIQIGYQDYLKFGKTSVLNFLLTVNRLTFRMNVLLSSFGFIIRHIFIDH